MSRPTPILPAAMTDQTDTTSASTETINFTVRLSLVQEDYGASITRHNVAATSEEQAVVKAIGLAVSETGRSGWELESTNGVEETAE
jgi:hypothetical protein